MRKLPVFFLIDVSESMIGEPLEWVHKGMEYLIRGLKSNPYALETVWIEVIAFAGQAKIVEPYEELPMFYPPEFPVGGGTALGKGLDFLMAEIDKHVRKSSPTTKGDWKPLVFIFTDGQPTDDFENALSRWENQYKWKNQTLIATLGDCCSVGLLNRIAHEAVKLEDSNKGSFDSYFKWMTDSIVKSSIQVSEGVQGGENFGDIRKDDGLTKIDLDKSEVKAPVDENVVVILGACQNNREKYLIKYVMDIEYPMSHVEDVKTVYRMQGAYKIDYNTYKDMSQNAGRNQVGIQHLRGVPPCPYCDSPHAMAICQCGGIFCANVHSETQTCAWCGETGHYGASNENFDIDRRLG
ncbi:MAG: VWA domain-containing protein [Bacteroidales bacterium]|nr:VWA domain-containing protein [Bacteroidales bacterium]